jgi:hypothetical protein
VQPCSHHRDDEYGVQDTDGRHHTQVLPARHVSQVTRVTGEACHRLYVVAQRIEMARV